MTVRAAAWMPSVLASSMCGTTIALASPMTVTTISTSISVYPRSGFIIDLGPGSCGSVAVRVALDRHAALERAFHVRQVGVDLLEQIDHLLALGAGVGNALSFG